MGSLKGDIRGAQTCIVTCAIYDKKGEEFLGYLDGCYHNESEIDSETIKELILEARERFDEIIGTGGQCKINCYVVKGYNNYMSGGMVQ